MHHKTKTKPLFYFFFAMTALGVLSGCSSADEPEPQDQTTTLHPLFACIDEEFNVNRPLAGNGYDAEQGGLIGSVQESYVVHTTQIFVPPEAETDFFTVLGPVIAQLAETPGLVGYSLAGDAGCGDYRTLGIWESEEAMYDFVLSGAHAEAMPQTGTLSEAARVTHWTATAAEVNALDWDVAQDKIRDIQQSDLY